MKNPNKIENSSKKSKKRKPWLTKDNLYIPKKFSQRSFSRWFYQFADRYNWGGQKDNYTLSPKGFRWKTETILNAWKNKSHTTLNYLKMKEKNIDTHLYSASSNHSHLYLFYTTSPFSDIALLCIDIDCKEGFSHSNCKEAAQYILSNFHPSCYYEPSTNGEGVHFYFFVDFSTFDKCGYYDRANCNSIIRKYSDMLKRLINDKFDVNFDEIKGTYLVDKQYSNRGKLCKAPQPKNKEDLYTLTHSPIFTCSDMGSNFDSFQRLMGIYPTDKAASTNTDDRDNNSLSYLSTLSSPLTIGETCLSEYDSLDDIDETGNDSEVDITRVKSNKCEEMMKSSNAGERCHGSIMDLAQKLGRLPTIEQWHTYYIKRNLHTGTAILTEIREDRFNKYLKIVSKTFDPSVIARFHTPGEYIDDLKARITSEQMDLCCERANYCSDDKFRKITYEDLDMGAGYVFICCMSNHKIGQELTVPTKGWIEYHRHQKEQGKIQRLCNKGKIRAVKLALIDASYIVCLDETSDFGRAMRYGLGVNHPKYAEYELFCKKLEDKFTNSSLPPVCLVSKTPDSSPASIELASCENVVLLE